REELYLDRQDILRLVPPDSSFVLVDNQEFASRVISTGRRSVPFLEKDGEYNGPPADGSTAIQELVRMHVEGHNFIVFARPAFWYFDTYPEFTEYLETFCSCRL